MIIAIRRSKPMRGITPSLWFDDRAEEAARFYTSVFPDSRVGRIARYGEAGAKISGHPAGSVMTVDFELQGQAFVALNGGPQFPFTEAVSFIVHCESQEEVDHYWDALSEGGEPGPCGWLKDRYGVSWQIVPTILYEILDDEDTTKWERMMEALLGMKKLDVEGLRRAAEGG
jgi:predicted 3-demethylubiquinone-9 3-methyltransferase (glyoxalase superfamily)